MSNKEINVRALQLGERIEVKGLEREDAFSSVPLAFRTSGDGIAVLFKSGAAVFIGMNPVDEEALIRGLAERIIEPLVERETETVRLIVKPDEDATLSPSGDLQIKSADNDRLLLVAEALAMSVAFAYDERRIAVAFDRIEEIAKTLQKRHLPRSPQGDLLGADRRSAADPAAAGGARRPRRQARRVVGPSGAGALLGAPRRRVRPRRSAALPSRASWT